ncbi:MAG: orotate phosphoribosyltransferase [Patescibacteria group bacterium]
MESIAKYLLEKEAVKVKMDPPFTWTSGIKSPVYCDNRKMLGFVGAREAIVEAFKKLIEEKKLEFNVIGGTATAAIAWAAFLAQELHKPMIYIRPEKKAHGTGKQIEGFLQPGNKVLIVEDLISTGGSSVNAAEVVRNEGGCIVEDILAIVSWEMPNSKKLFEEAKLNLHNLTGYTEITKLASESGAISPEQLDLVMKFKENPEAWGAGLGV